MKRAVVLLSGGLDSTVVTYAALAEGYEVIALTLTYGQLHTTEIDKAKITTSKHNIEHFVVPVSLPWKGSALLDDMIPIPTGRDEDAMSDIPATYVPARNTIFLSLALSLAEVRNATAIFIGANQLDFSGYPDCRGDYFQSAQQLFDKATKQTTEGEKIKIVTPLLDMTKEDIVRFGQTLDVPFEDTWTCYVGGNAPCGTCDACVLRSKGFSAVGIQDPIVRDGSAC